MSKDENTVAHPLEVIDQLLGSATGNLKATMDMCLKMYGTHLSILAVLAQRNGGTLRIENTEADALPKGFDVKFEPDQTGMTMTYVAPRPPQADPPKLVGLDGKALNRKS